MRQGLLLSALLLFTACGEEELQSLSGTYVEMEDFTTLKFRSVDEKGRTQTTRFQINETQVEHSEALLPGAPVQIYFRGRLSSDEQKQAVRIVVDDTYARLIGRWIERDEAEFDMGIELLAGGLARSIGMQTVAFNRWEYSSEGIRLGGNTLGGGNAVAFSEVWQVEELTDSLLTLTQPDLVIRFRRESEAHIAAREARAEAARLAAEAEKKSSNKRSKNSRRI